MITLPSGVVPVQDLTTEEILYGSRTTAFRYELLTHDPATGLDNLSGFLDGVELDGSLKWSLGAAVKRSGTLTVLDLDVASAGLTRIGDVDLVTTRIRPVLTIEGLPDIPLSVYVVTASPESWSATGRRFALELHDKATVLDQDMVAGSYTVAAGTVTLTAIGTVVASAGETIAVDATNTATVAVDMVWPAGTTKLTIVNDLLASLNYSSLSVDGVGAFRAVPYILPANRPINYAILNDPSGAPLPRQLVDGAESIYQEAWTLTRDSYRVPNKVVAVEVGTGTGTPSTGVATNTDPTSPYSYAARGRWIVATLSGVAVPTLSPTDTVTFLNGVAQRSLIAQSAVQAAVQVSCLPIPVDLLDAVRFQSTPAGVDARHTVQGIQIAMKFDGLMQLDLQEVISL